MNRTKLFRSLPAACSIGANCAAGSERDGMQPVAGLGAAPTAGAVAVGRLQGAFGAT